MERNQRVGCDFIHNAIQARIMKFCFEFHKQQTQNNTLFKIILMIIKMIIIMIINTTHNNYMKVCENKTNVNA